MLCASRACYAPRGHAMRLASILCTSQACYAPRGHALRLAITCCERPPYTTPHNSRLHDCRAFSHPLFGAHHPFFVAAVDRQLHLAIFNMLKFLTARAQGCVSGERLSALQVIVVVGATLLLMNGCSSTVLRLISEHK